MSTGQAIHPQVFRTQLRQWLRDHAEQFKGLPTASVYTVAQDIASLVELEEEDAAYATRKRRGAALKDPKKTAPLCEFTDISDATAGRALRLLVVSGWIEITQDPTQGHQGRYGLRQPAIKGEAAFKFVDCAVEEFGIKPKSKSRDTRKARSYLNAKRTAAKEEAAEETSTTVEGTVTTIPSEQCHDSPLKQCHDSAPEQCRDSPPLPTGVLDNWRGRRDSPPPGDVGRPQSRDAAVELGSAGRRRPGPRDTVPKQWAHCVCCGFERRIHDPGGHCRECLEDLEGRTA